MTCITCGNVLTQDAHFCPRCGHAVQPPAASAVYPPAAAILHNYRVSRNLQTLGILWLVYAALRMLAGFAGMLFFHGLFHRHTNDFNFGWSPFGHMGVESFLPLALGWLTIGVACTLLTGYGLITRQSWGRVLAIVFAIFALFHFPLGTALGIYTLWVLAPKLSGDEYATLAYAAHGN